MRGTIRLLIQALAWYSTSLDLLLDLRLDNRAFSRCESRQMGAVSKRLHLARESTFLLSTNNEATRKEALILQQRSH